MIASVSLEHEVATGCRGRNTPAYVYDVAELYRRVARLRSALSLQISYAVKANPNAAILAELATLVDCFDVSSIGEVRRVLAAASGARMTFVGPAKRRDELQEFLSLDAGVVVLESLDEARDLASVVAERGGGRVPVIVRLRPSERRAGFGASMSGRHSHFGIAASAIADTLPTIVALGCFDLVGFHSYHGTNSLDPAAIAAGFAEMTELFAQAASVTGVKPAILIFGAGFGIPYTPEDRALDLDAVARALAPVFATIAADPALSAATLTLELGRWIVGPAGRLLTRAIRVNEDGEPAIAICDAGFNTNLAAAGMLGGGLRRNWRIRNLDNPGGDLRRYHLVGPLCTSLDRLASNIDLPEIRKGDMLMIENAGAYGPTASPTRFISHPEPAEYLLRDGIVSDTAEAFA